jgi:hypothetical protein
MRKTAWWREGLKMAQKMQDEELVLLFHTDYANEDTFLFVNSNKHIKINFNGNKNDFLRKYNFYFRYFLKVDYRSKDTLFLVVDEEKLEKYKILYKEK